VQVPDNNILKNRFDMVQQFDKYFRQKISDILVGKGFLLPTIFKRLVDNKKT